MEIDLSEVWGVGSNRRFCWRAELAELANDGTVARIKFRNQIFRFFNHLLLSLIKNQPHNIFDSNQGLRVIL
jgi:hypothetical protein